MLNESGDWWWDIEQTVYESDGVTLFEDNYDLINNTAKPLTLLVAVQGMGAEVSYFPLLTDYGLDEDGDAYYTQDWDTSRDCDDTDGSVTDDCY